MSAYQETKVHGRQAFPYAVYMGLVPEYLSGFPLHWHEEMEIIYVREGAVGVSVRNNEYTVRGGELVLLHPQTIHAIKQVDDCRGLYYNILFRLSMLSGGGDDVCRDKYLEPICRRQLLMPEFVGSGHPLNARLTPLLRPLLTDPERQCVQDELLIKARLLEILHHLLPYCEQSDKSSAYEDVIYDKLKQSLEYIEQNYADNITVARMAAVSNYSASHFAKLFRQLTGDSLTQYLKNYRLEIAANRLLNEKTRISEIAVACGFSNLSYFSRAFYEKYRVTPSEFRRNGGNN